MSLPPTQQRLAADVLANEAYRRVLFTEPDQFQMVAMSVPEFLPLESHDDNIQEFMVHQGTGRAIIGGREQRVEPGSFWIVPRGVDHTLLVDRESGAVKLLTIYYPPHHAPDRVDLTMPDSG